MQNLRIGTCSWKYDSWKGLIYPEFGEFNYLEEYSRKYNTVEIDQWFWSLHPNNKIKLPNPKVVEEYDNSTPDDFKFTIKIPNSITLTHPYKSQNINTHFLSVDLMETFLELLKPIKSKIGMFIFQFEYLNKQKMGSQIEFQEKLIEFFSDINSDFNYAIEIRNPNYLNDNWFKFLNHLNISFVFLHGYYLPPIYETFNNFHRYILNNTVIRLHGFNRKGIELKTKKIWNNIVNPQNNELLKIVDIMKGLLEKEVDIYLNVNNHYEGSAPLTIEKINQLLP